MTMTTIKVRREVRDELKRQAAAEHRTLGEHLAFLATLADRHQRIAQLRREIAATSPEDLASYHEESAWWSASQDG